MLGRFLNLSLFLIFCILLLFAPGSLNITLNETENETGNRTINETDYVFPPENLTNFTEVNFTETQNITLNSTINSTYFLNETVNKTSENLTSHSFAEEGHPEQNKTLSSANVTSSPENMTEPGISFDLKKKYLLSETIVIRVNSKLPVNTTITDSAGRNFETSKKLFSYNPYEPVAEGNYTVYSSSDFYENITQFTLEIERPEILFIPPPEILVGAPAEIGVYSDGVFEFFSYVVKGPAGEEPGSCPAVCNITFTPLFSGNYTIIGRAVSRGVVGEANITVTAEYGKPEQLTKEFGKPVLWRKKITALPNTPIELPPGAFDIEHSEETAVKSSGAGRIVSIYYRTPAPLAFEKTSLGMSFWRKNITFSWPETKYHNLTIETEILEGIRPSLFLGGKNVSESPSFEYSLIDEDEDGSPEKVSFKIPDSSFSGFSLNSGESLSRDAVASILIDERRKNDEGGRIFEDADFAVSLFELYEGTGKKNYLEKAFSVLRELRLKQSEDGGFYRGNSSFIYDNTDSLVAFSFGAKYKESYNENFEKLDSFIQKNFFQKRHICLETGDFERPSFGTTCRANEMQDERPPLSGTEYFVMSRFYAGKVLEDGNLIEEGVRYEPQMEIEPSEDLFFVYTLAYEATGNETYLETASSIKENIEVSESPFRKWYFTSADKKLKEARGEKLDFRDIVVMDIEDIPQDSIPFILYCLEEDEP